MAQKKIQKIRSIDEAMGIIGSPLNFTLSERLPFCQETRDLLQTAPDYALNLYARMSKCAYRTGPDTLSKLRRFEQFFSNSAGRGLTALLAGNLLAIAADEGVIRDAAACRQADISTPANKDLRSVLAFLWERGAKDSSFSQIAALSKTAYNGDYAAMKFLLELGAKAEGHDRNGETPLMLACRGGGMRTEMAKLLLAAGADPNAKSLSTRAYRSSQLTPMAECVLYHGTPELCALLIDAGADPCEPFDGCALHEHPRTSDELRPILFAAAERKKLEAAAQAPADKAKIRL